jgi:hypothetical protein
VQRSVEQRECGALAGAVEGGAGVDLVATLDVRGRQRTQRTCDFGNAEIREMTLFERAEPGCERRGIGDQDARR